MKRFASLTHPCGSAVLTGLAAWAHSAGVLGAKPYPLLSDARLFWWSLFLLVHVVAAYALGIPESRRSSASAMIRSVASLTMSLSLISLCQLILATPLLPRAVSALLASSLIVWGGVSQSVHARFVRSATGRSKVVLVGGDCTESAGLVEDISSEPNSPHRLARSISVSEASRPGVIADAVGETGANLLVLSRDAAMDDSILTQAEELHFRGLPVRSLSEFFEGATDRIPHSLMHRSMLMFDISELHGGSTYQRLKRLMDVAVAFVGLAALAPLILIVALLNPLFNPGPLLYRQQRVGRGGEPFTILKLRTMTPSATNEGDAERTAANDQRVTRLGGLLRKSHLDELPQVINIWRGDLSIVGPRPEQPGYDAELSSSTPVYRLRHTVRPGLTGWAQVRQGYVSTQADSLTKLQYDLFYLRHQSLGLDCKVLWMTLREVVSGLGR